MMSFALIGGNFVAISWEIKDFDFSCYEDLQNKLDISPAITKLLMLRGIDTENKIKTFLYGDLTDLSNPYELSNMDKAVARIKSAIEKQEKVVIYGDYDVDGICSTVILLECLAMLGLKADYYVPDRFSEGYGLNIEAIGELAQKGYKLVITVDCGIASVDEVILANSLGLDFIITDHHTPSIDLPPAIAIVNPKLDNNETNYNLCGAGVAYQLALALGRGALTDEQMGSWLDLAALATVADIVPLIGDNRIIVKYGLKKIENTQRLGLKALLSVSGLEDKIISSWHIGYILAPRLNAAGRMDTASLSIELLQATNYQVALQLANKLADLNNYRRSVEEQIFKAAVSYIENNINLEQENIIVVAGEAWHQGVIGIVASRLVDKYNRPVIIISWEDDIGRGSGRSIDDFNLYEALNNVKEHLIQFGGHKLAAGLTLKKTELLNFKAKLLTYSLKDTTEVIFFKKEIIDLELKPEEINEKLLEELKLLEPFGEGNYMPKFLGRGFDISSPSLVGKNKDHFKFKLLAGAVDAIAFGKSNYAKKPLSLLKYDIAFNIEENEFLGKKSLQLKVSNIKPTITPDKPYLLNNLRKPQTIMQEIIDELEKKRPVTLIYPTYRTLMKHYSTLKEVFNHDFIKLLHGNIYVKERAELLNDWEEGKPYLFLISQAYLDYYLQNNSLPSKLNYLLNIWPNMSDHFSKEDNIIVNHLFDTRKIELCQEKVDIDQVERAVIYTNRPTTIEKLTYELENLVIIAGQSDYQKRKKLMQKFLKSKEAVLLLDGAYDFYGNDMTSIDSMLLADVPFSYYESMLAIEQISATEDIKMVTLFDETSIISNKAYLARNYPDVNTVKQVLQYFKSLQTNFIKSEIKELNVKVANFIKRDEKSFNILPVLWILADLGLCDVSKQGSIMAINFLKVNNTKLDISNSPYYLEGVAEKIAFMEWEQMILNG